MPDPRDTVIQSLCFLVEDILPQTPETVRGLLHRQYLRVKDSYDSLPGTAFNKQITPVVSEGASNYWRHYRDTQQFEFDFRDTGSEIIVGIDNAIKRSGLRPQAFKRKLAVGRGTLFALIQEDGRDRSVTITRLPR